MTRPTRALEAAVFRLLMRLAHVVPRPAWLRLGGAAGALAGWVDRRHRRIAADNLRLAFGESLDPSEARRIVRACWMHFGRVLVDTLRLPALACEDVTGLVRYRGLEHVRAAYASGRGVLLFSGHYGHWELVAFAQGLLGMPLALLTRPLDNPRLEAVLADLRTRSGNVIIPHRGSTRKMIRVLRRGQGVAIVIDQDAREHGVFVPFFGRLASTTPTLARLALRTGATVVPVFSVPETDGTYTVTYEPPVSVESADDREGEVRRLTAECTAILERWVRRHPELWLWMHRRWKTPPPCEPVSR